MRRHLAVSTCLLSVLSSFGCDEKPAPSAAAAAASAAVTPPLPPPPAPKPEPSAAPAETAATGAPKPAGRKLADCPKGPNVEFLQPEIEAEVRKKLPKPEGPITNADLAKLRSLNLSQVKLSELDVCVFSRLKAAKELFLGPGDYSDLSPIAGLTQLESLRVSINQVKDLKPLEGMANLDRLDLGRTQVSDLKPIAKLTKITELQLDDTPVEDVSPLAGMSGLQILSLKRTRVKDVTALKGLKKIKTLYIGGSPLDADIMSVAPIRANGAKISSD
ncbi:MAG: leucine-rich repeat domain-containing protein [Polyangiaceae bacterium]